MANWRTRFAKDEKTIGSWDLDNGKGGYNSVIVHIEKFFEAEFISQMGKEVKTYAQLREFKKPMIFNKTNFKRCSTFFGSMDDDDYIGKPIVLGVEQVPDPQGGKGAKVDGLRFSTRPLPVQQPTKPPIDDENFPKAIASVKSGAMTLEKLKETRSLTPEQIKQLDAI